MPQLAAIQLTMVLVYVDLFNDVIFRPYALRQADKARNKAFEDISSPDKLDKALEEENERVKKIAGKHLDAKKNDAAQHASVGTLEEEYDATKENDGNKKKKKAIKDAIRNEVGAGPGAVLDSAAVSAALTKWQRVKN